MCKNGGFLWKHIMIMEVSGNVRKFRFRFRRSIRKYSRDWNTSCSRCLCRNGRSVEKTLECFGKIDVLVNNHAVQFIQHSILDISPQQLHLVFQNNIISFFYMIQAGQPCEVSPCYVFLASEDASYMTGQVMHPNGGTIVA